MRRLHGAAPPQRSASLRRKVEPAFGAALGSSFGAAAGRRTMSRYFFDMVDGWLSRDPEGSEFPDMKAARSRAIKMAAEILRAESEDFEHPHAWSFIVRDERGEAVFRLQVRGETVADGGAA
jgi:hypothetical protein